jgi:hypothetical protein
MADLEALSLPELRARLEDHLLARPVMPTPYQPSSPEGKAFYDARLAWSATWRELEHEVWKRENPPMVFRRCPPCVVPKVYRQPPVRLRR